VELRGANCQRRLSRGWALIERDSKNRGSRAARVAGNDAAIFHFVDPIAALGDNRIVRR